EAGASGWPIRHAGAVVGNADWTRHFWDARSGVFRLPNGVWSRNVLAHWTPHVGLRGQGVCLDGTARAPRSFRRWHRYRIREAVGKQRGRAAGAALLSKGGVRDDRSWKASVHERRRLATGILPYRRIRAGVVRSSPAARRSHQQTRLGSDRDGRRVRYIVLGFRALVFIGADQRPVWTHTVGMIPDRDIGRRAGHGEALWCRCHARGHRAG